MQIHMNFESGVLLEALKFKLQQAKHIGKLELLKTHTRLLTIISEGR